MSKGFSEKKYLMSAATTGGRDRLWNYIRQDHDDISRREVARYLAEDPISQKHQPLQKRITTRVIVVKDKAKVAGIDLVDTQQLAGYNGGVSYLLTYVDMLSKYCAVRGIKIKTQKTVTEALMDILDSMHKDWQPEVIQSDRGSEFSVGMERDLKNRGIKLIHSQAYNPRSNGGIERLNRTIKSTMFFFTQLDMTQKIICSLFPT